MKLQRYITSAIAICVMVSTSAFAHDDGWYRHDERYEIRHHHAKNDWPHYRVDDYVYVPYRPPHYGRVYIRGAGPWHDWYEGTVLPAPYRIRQYVVIDWREHHLYSPPRGYHWVHVGDDYVLAAIATGVIMSVLLH